MSKLIDLTGMKFGRWTVESKADNNKRNETMWNCICNCGSTKEIYGPNLKKGLTTSCGCLIKEGTKHGFASAGNASPEYISWGSMIQRCTNEKSLNYKNYGARGISIYKPWLNNFKKFYEYIGPRPSLNHSLDRIDVNGNYEPDNVRWATKEEQSRNKRINKTNKTGISGVCWDKSHSKYLVRIGEKFVGYANTISEAGHMRKEAELKYWSF